MCLWADICLWVSVIMDPETSDNSGARFTGGCEVCHYVLVPKHRSLSVRMWEIFENNKKGSKYNSVRTHLLGVCENPWFNISMRKKVKKKKGNIKGRYKITPNF